MSIKNINELRDFISNQLEALCKGFIEPEKANAISMLSANMLLSARLEMEYSKLKQISPSIEFMENKSVNVIDVKPLKSVNSKSHK